MPSVSLFHVRLGLGPDDDVDILPRRFDQPNLFVPFQYDYLSDTLRHFFPNVDVPGQHLQYDVNNRQARRWAKQNEGASAGVNGDDDLMNVNGDASTAPRGRKRAREMGEDEDDGERVLFDCELVPHQAEETALGTQKLRYEPQYYDTLAVVALLSTKMAAQGKKRKGKGNPYAESLVEAAYTQRSQRQSNGTQDGAGPKTKGREGIILGHIVPSRIKAPNHPLSHLHPTLLRQDWVHISRCTVSLKLPFLPAEDIFGPASVHPIGRAVPFLPPQVDNAGDLIWRDPVTKQVWSTCPRRMLPAPQLFGSLKFQVELTDEAFGYGSDAAHDGFVVAPVVPRRNLTLSGKLKSLISAVLEVSLFPWCSDHHR
jgi:hypothetical protein